MRNPATIQQCLRNCADSSPHLAACEDAASEGTEGVGGCGATQRGSFQSVRPAMDRRDFHYHGKHQRKAHTYIGDAHVNAEKHPRHRGLRTKDATNSTSNDSVHCRRQHSVRTVGGTPCQDCRTNRVTRG